MSDNLESRVAKLEADVAELKKSPAPATGSAKVADDRLLDNPWADKEVRKDPTFWKGASYVGRRWSECPPEYLDKLAAFMEFCAQKDSEKPEEEQPKNNKGEPWWKSTLFEASLVRARAARKRAQTDSELPI